MKLLIAVLLLASTALHAQRVVDVNKNEYVDQSMMQVVGGQPFVNVKFINLVEGSPYFQDNWMKGMLVSAKGDQYKGGLYKLDLIDNELHFLDNGKEYVTATALKEITLIDTTNGSSYHFVHSSTLPLGSNMKRGWYIRLADGNVSAYQFLRKQANESRPYNSATTELKISTYSDYYLLINNAMTNMKKLKEVPDLLPGKKIELESWLKANDGKGSMGEKLASLVTYYNSLKD
jgi:hypothetical protein